MNVPSLDGVATESDLRSLLKQFHSFHPSALMWIKHITDGVSVVITDECLCNTEESEF